MYRKPTPHRHPSPALADDENQQVALSRKTGSLRRPDDRGLTDTARRSPAESSSVQSRHRVVVLPAPGAVAEQGVGGAAGGGDVEVLPGGEAGSPRVAVAPHHHCDTVDNLPAAGRFGGAGASDDEDRPGLQVQPVLTQQRRKLERARRDGGLS